MSSRNNELFLRYFEENLKRLVVNHLDLFESRKSDELPLGLWVNHITSTFIDTLRWWIDNGMKESPETITKYFYLTV